MDSKIIVKEIIDHLGGKANILSVTNCMTRLRTVVKDESLVDEGQLKSMAVVLGLVHDRANAFEVVVGPGKSREFANLCHEMGLASAGSEDGDWRQNKAAIKSKQKNSRLKTMLKALGDIFIPLIPGIIAAGLCAGFAALIAQLVPNYQDIRIWYLIHTLLTVINVAFMTYITAWAGYRAAERFGATPILGGMLGMITSLTQIDTISQILGLYNADSPLQSVLKSGKGGVLAVICGVFLLAFVEKKIRKKMPASLDIVLTPLLTLLICVIPYILLIMPAFGFVSNGIVWVFSKACMSEIAIVRIAVGFLGSALFLPLVASGMHHGLVALYSVQLQELGFVTLYPALAMAGAGQVGAAIALYQKAKRLKHKKLCSVIGGSLPAGFLGVGEPLIYGVTLPMGRPFITAGIGAGFGGAFVMFCQVASTTWGPSGLLGVFVMTAGPSGAVKSMCMYLVGLVISYVMSYLITRLVIQDKEVADALGGIPLDAVDSEKIEENPSPENTGEMNGLSTHPKVLHGDKVTFDLAPSETVDQDAATVPQSVSAPVDGEYIPMAEIPDPVFAQGTIGKCFGILPDNGKVYAPIAGKILSIAETGHAITLLSDNGGGILVHIGIDTVTLGGKAFVQHVNVGESVKKDQLMTEVDLEMIHAAGLSSMVITAAVS